jgi:hypothetical protein
LVGEALLRTELFEEKVCLVSKAALSRHSRARVYVEAYMAVRRTSKSPDLCACSALTQRLRKRAVFGWKRAVIYLRLAV